MIDIEVSGNDTDECRAVAYFIYKALRDAGHEAIGGFNPLEASRPILERKIIITVAKEGELI